MWKTLSSLVELIIVEDKKTEDAKKIAKEIGARYYSKKNGNWGSVVNFAVSKKLIKTGVHDYYGPGRYDKYRGTS